MLIFYRSGRAVDMGKTCPGAGAAFDIAATSLPSTTTEKWSCPPQRRQRPTRKVNSNLPAAGGARTPVQRTANPLSELRGNGLTEVQSKSI